MRYFSKEYEQIENIYVHAALENGFTKEELSTCYLDGLNSKTKSEKTLRAIELAYFIGWIKGVKACSDSLFIDQSVIDIGEEVKNEAIRKGFPPSELDEEALVKKESTKRSYRLVQLALQRGIIRGVRHVDELKKQPQIAISQ